MPSLFRCGSYLVYFWSNENNEPIHVHVSKGRPAANSTKLWLTSAGGCVVANNSSDIPQKDLREIVEMVSAQFFWLCKEWKQYFSVDKIKFYC